MKDNRLTRALIAVLCSIALLGGTAMLESSPANAAVGKHWTKIWKKKIRPLADKRYYTKKKARAKFAAKSALAGYTPLGTSYTKAESDSKYATVESLTAALANYYTKAQADAKYASVNSVNNLNAAVTTINNNFNKYYTKAEADAKYAPGTPTVVRGDYYIRGAVASGIGQTLGTAISFGTSLAQAPTVHFIPAGATTLPQGCSGSVAAPDASSGHLCVFEQSSQGVASQTIRASDGQAGSDTFGATIDIGAQPAAVAMFSRGTWVLRP